jgi:threonine/homoserine/homoserine lactone efflux protein
MLDALLIGAGFAFAAAIQPGPLQAYFLSSVLQRGWKATLPAALAPLISDGPIAVMSLFILSNIQESTAQLLRAAGGLFLLYIAIGSFSKWKLSSLEDATPNSSRPRTILQAALINFFNPNVYIAWSLVIGPSIISAWSRKPIEAVILILAFYITIVLVGAAVIILLGTTSFLNTINRKRLILVSAILLAALGIFQLSSSVIWFTTFYGTS